MKETDYKEKLKAAIEKKKVLFGYKEAIKAVKSNKADTVVIAINCPVDFKNTLVKTYKENVMEFDGTGKQLGVFCGKPFPVSVLVINK